MDKDFFDEAEKQVNFAAFKEMFRQVLPGFVLLSANIFFGATAWILAIVGIFNLPVWLMALSLVWVGANVGRAAFMFGKMVPKVKEAVVAATRGDDPPPAEPDTSQVKPKFVSKNYLLRLVRVLIPRIALAGVGLVALLPTVVALSLTGGLVAWLVAERVSSYVLYDRMVSLSRLTSAVGKPKDDTWEV